MQPSEFQKLWKKVQDLEAKCVLEGKSLSRNNIKSHFQLTENKARLVYEALKLRGVISPDLKADVSVREDNRKTKAKLKEAEKQVEKLRRQAEICTSLDDYRLDPPKWIMPAIPKKDSSIALAMLSDTHFDEFIDPAAILWKNGYNREIAVCRLRKYTESVIKLDRDYFAGTKTQALVLAILGDMLSGTIHEELAETNEAEPTESVMFWAEQLVSCINLLLEHFRRIYAPCVIGNHGRTKRKVEFKNDVKKSWDWLLYCMVAKEFRNNKHVQFNISTSTDVYFPIYNTHMCGTHGNQFRGGQGWAGAMMPVMRGDMKKRKRQNSVKRPYDYLLVGHFHTLQFLQWVVMNGSMVGYGEFPDRGNFDFEEAAQAFCLIDPKRGMTLRAPIHCKCDNESWEQKQSTEKKEWW